MRPSSPSSSSSGRKLLSEILDMGSPALSAEEVELENARSLLRKLRPLSLPLSVIGRRVIFEGTPKELFRLCMGIRFLLPKGGVIWCRPNPCPKILGSTFPELFHYLTGRLRLWVGAKRKGLGVWSYPLKGMEDLLEEERYEEYVQEIRRRNRKAFLHKISRGWLGSPLPPQDP